jgi:TRAP-type C4-dicarboxylate transport system permease large subunit
MAVWRSHEFRLDMMLHVGWIFAAMVLCFALLQYAARWPLPLNLIVVSVAAALLAGFGIPFRHLVEGGFGYLNLILALFAGAFFGQAMRRSGATERLAELVAARERRFLPLLLAGFLLFVAGMVTGIAGVAVLAVGAFAAPLLRVAGLSPTLAAAYIALFGTIGMVAPPLNVPAMIMADGVNMPFAGFAGSLWALSLPTAVFAFATFAGRTSAAAPDAAGRADGATGVFGILVLLATIGFWGLLRYWPGLMRDPSIPLVLAVGGLLVMLTAPRTGWREVFGSVFSGTPLLLAAVLVTVGVLVQIMALTGIRGWLVIQTMSFESPWNYLALIGIPVLGSVLTAMGAANSLGVPFAFAFIHQDMIVNISALSAIAVLSEFCPPTAIATALSAYVVGEQRLWPIIRASLPTLAVLTALSVVMLIFAPALAPYLR